VILYGLNKKLIFHAVYKIVILSFLIYLIGGLRLDLEDRLMITFHLVLAVERHFQVFNFLDFTFLVSTMCSITLWFFLLILLRLSGNFSCYGT